MPANEATAAFESAAGRGTTPRQVRDRRTGTASLNRSNVRAYRWRQSLHLLRRWLNCVYLCQKAPVLPTAAAAADVCHVCDDSGGLGGDGGGSVHD